MDFSDSNYFWNEYDQIKYMVLRKPEQSFISQNNLDSQWEGLNFTSVPNYPLAAKEYEAFVDILKDAGIHIDYLPAGENLTIDSIYVRDASIVTPKGIVLCYMGKKARQLEPRIAGNSYEKLGLKILGGIHGDGRIEGGDLIWLNEHCLAVGRTYRTNDSGINQLKNLLGPDIEVRVVNLPHYKGVSDVFHLMSIISPIDHDLALVYSPLMPVDFREWLIERGIKLVEVPDEEFESMGCNVLAIAPRVAVMIKGNPQTKARLEQAGTKVIEVSGDEICQKGQGGPTCLTRPILRIK